MWHLQHSRRATIILSSHFSLLFSFFPGQMVFIFTLFFFFVWVCVCFCFSFPSGYMFTFQLSLSSIQFDWWWSSNIHSHVCCCCYSCSRSACDTFARLQYAENVVNCLFVSEGISTKIHHDYQSSKLFLNSFIELTTNNQDKLGWGRTSCFEWGGNHKYDETDTEAYNSLIRTFSSSSHFIHSFIVSPLRLFRIDSYRLKLKFSNQIESFHSFSIFENFENFFWENLLCLAMNYMVKCVTFRRSIMWVDMRHNCHLKFVENCCCPKIHVYYNTSRLTSDQ